LRLEQSVCEKIYSNKAEDSREEKKVIPSWAPPLLIAGTTGIARRQQANTVRKK
jgi:DNA gyrase/topoisomerase IV subunit A